MCIRDSHVVLVVPYSKESHHTIGAAELALMKPTAVLVNIARGGIVDDVALAKALREGRIAAAGLDVFEGEALVAEENLLLRRQARPEQLQSVLETRALLSRENVVLTPHIGFYSEEALGRIMETTIANIRGFLSGEPRNLVG